MDSCPSLKRAEFVEALDHLDAVTWELAGLIRRRATDAWIWRDPDEPLPDKADMTAAAVRRRDLDAAGACFRALEYVDDQKGNETLRCVGLIAVPADVIACAQRTNEAKDRLGRAWTGLAHEKIQVEAPEGEGTLWVSLRDHTLEGCGRARHHQRQAERHIVTIDRPVHSVSFSWARVPAIHGTDCRRIRQKLEERLEEGSTLAEADLKRLEGMPADEPLALVGPTHLQPRANIKFREPDGTTSRKMVRAMSPILVLAERLPKFRRLPAAPLPANYRLAREKTIADEPFLQTLNVHRYLSPPAAGGP